MPYTLQISIPMYRRYGRINQTRKTSQTFSSPFLNFNKNTKKKTKHANTRNRQLQQARASLALINISFLLLSRWGKHASRCRHGPHPWFLWLLRTFDENSCYSEGINNFTLRCFKILFEKTVINKSRGEVCQVWWRGNSTEPRENALAVEERSGQRTNRSDWWRAGENLEPSFSMYTMSCTDVKICCQTNK